MNYLKISESLKNVEYLPHIICSKEEYLRLKNFRQVYVYLGKIGIYLNLLTDNIAVVVDSTDIELKGKLFSIIEGH